MNQHRKKRTLPSFWEKFMGRMLEICKHIIFTAKVNLRFVGLSRFFADMKSFYVWMDFMREDAIFTTFYADTIHGNRCYEAMTTPITFLQIIFELTVSFKVHFTLSDVPE